MQVHLRHSRLVEAPAETVVEVLTDYVSHPRFDPTLVRVTVVRQDADGAELVADRTIRRRRQVHAVDRYDRGDDVTIDRTEVGDPTRTTWTVHRISTRRSRLTVEAGRELRAHRALLVRPRLRRDLLRIDLVPFVGEAERRASLDDAQP
jgi:hypothetical protein